MAIQPKILRRWTNGFWGRKRSGNSSQRKINRYLSMTLCKRAILQTNLARLTPLNWTLNCSLRPNSARIWKLSNKKRQLHRVNRVGTARFKSKRRLLPSKGRIQTMNCKIRLLWWHRPQRSQPTICPLMPETPRRSTCAKLDSKRSDKCYLKREMAPSPRKKTLSSCEPENNSQHQPISIIYKF